MSPINKRSFKYVCEELWQLESEYNLLKKKIQGVYVWQCLRHQIFSMICHKLGLMEIAHDKVDADIEKIKDLSRSFKNSVIDNPLLNEEKKEILIFRHPRKKKIEGKYIDIYTEYLVRELDENSYEIYEDPNHNPHFVRKEDEVKNLDFLNILYFFYFRYKNINKINYENEERKFIDKIQSEINGFFNIDLKFKKMVDKAIIKFQCYHWFYDNLLEKKEPNVIYLVVSYGGGKSPLISAAKERGIKVIELEHGTMNPYHLGYNFPKNNDIEYFPDEFYAWGKFWIESVDMPIKREDIKLYGFPHLENQIKKYNDIGKNKNQIIFISQGTIGKKLSEIAYNTAKKMPDYNFVYKLHPGEYKRWKKEYEHLKRARSLNNFEVVDNNEKDLYHYLAESEYLIGVNSTVIYEGLAFCCKPLIIKLPGSESMEYLIRKDVAKLVKKPEEIKEILLEFKDNSINSNVSYFYYNHQGI